MDRALAGLPAKVQNRVAGIALRAGAMILEEEARRNALVGIGGGMGGDIAGAIGIGRMRTVRGGGRAVNVSVDPHGDRPEFVHFTKDGTRQYIPAALEYGHAAPYDAKGTKIAAAIPFMRQAFHVKKAQAYEFARLTFISELDRAVRESVVF